jgi:hypothetical protein
MPLTSKEFLFHVTSPLDEKFYAAVVFVSTNKVYVISTRNGVWEPETLFAPEDLSSPMQKFYEWDIRRVDPGEAPARPKPEDFPLRMVKPA